MPIFNDKSRILELLPNRLRAAQGESPLDVKISPFVDQADVRLTNEVFSTSVVEQIHEPTHIEVLFHAQRAVAFEALRLAIPALDLVITPNGLAVVQSQTLAPASQQRTERLVANCIEMRDRNLNQAIKFLSAIPDWRTSPQGLFFAKSLVQLPEQVQSLQREREAIWDCFLRCRQAAINLELSLAAEFFSEELLEELRAAKLAGSLSVWQESLVNRIEAQLISCLNGKAISTNAMMDAVNFIRKNPAEFMTWHNSAVAKLFAPPVFENKKSASGYFI